MTEYVIEFGRTTKKVIDEDTFSDAIGIACDLAHASPGEDKVFYSVHVADQYERAMSKAGKKL